MRPHLRSEAQSFEHPVGEQEIPEKSCKQQVLSEEPLEERAGQGVPGDGVRDGGEDPVQLPKRCLPVVQPPRDLVNEVLGDACHAHLIRLHESAKRHLDRRGQACREEIGRMDGAHRQQLLGSARRQHDEVVGARLRLGVSPVCRLLGHVEERHERTGRVAVKDEDGRPADPVHEILDGQRHVLRERLVEDPHLSVLGRLGHSVAVVVQQQSIAPRRLPQAQAEVVHLVDGGIHLVLVARPGQLLELLQHSPADLLLGLLPRHPSGVEPALLLGAGLRLDHVRRVRAHVQAHDDPSAGRAHPWAESPARSGLFPAARVRIHAHHRALVSRRAQERLGERRHLWLGEVRGLRRRARHATCARRGLSRGWRRRQRRFTGSPTHILRAGRDGVSGTHRSGRDALSRIELHLSRFPHAGHCSRIASSR
mmetsp:Transcript_9983/g.37715  ORF Transcript_9983/g.37715 Transcript_9983/m.37715 type:complete len:424 (+) Transcript_9983:5891-7162(+)